LVNIEGNKRLLPYAGSPLNCDIFSAAIDADLTATTVTSIAYVACNSTDLRFTAETRFVYSKLPSLKDDGWDSPAQNFFNLVDQPQKFVATA
jgi:hypothetical protein